MVEKEALGLVCSHPPIQGQNQWFTNYPQMNVALGELQSADDKLQQPSET